MKKIKWKIKNFIHTIESCYLCIRFPFLYPRNRWHDKHYIWWRGQEYRDKNWDKAYKMTFTDDFKCNTECINKNIAFRIYCVNLIEKFLSIFHFIPTYTELDGMPSGWRKAFGIQMCKEIKRELKKHHYLYKYRITDIKEKYGGLRWYDNGSPDGCIYPIINKYENISYKTCIICGKPAQYITLGWIEPYCDKCKDQSNMKCEDILDDSYHYIMDVLESCVSEIQIENVYKWALSYFKKHTVNRKHYEKYVTLINGAYLDKKLL